MLLSTCGTLKSNLLLLCVMLILSANARTQSAVFPVDTTYTVKGSFEKVRQDYPGITMAAGVSDRYIGVARNVVYKTVGQRRLHLDVYGPKAATGALLPVVLMIHGGGWSSGNRSHMEVIARDLAFSGFVAMPVEYRRSPEIPYPAGLEDLQDAIRWIAGEGGRYRADAKRVVVLGASSGAQMATFLGTTQNDILPFKAEASSHIKAIINIDGIVSFVHPEARYEGNAASRWLGGPRETHWSTWTQASPLEYVDAESPPILFINGSMPRFHAGRDSLCRRYADHGMRHEVFEFEDAPHTFWFFHPWYSPMMYKILGFLGRL